MDNASDRLARVVEALKWYDAATKESGYWCPSEQGFFAAQYRDEDVICTGCGKWFPIREGPHEDAEVDHFFTLVRAAVKEEP